jgi:hypothetical protein
MRMEEGSEVGRAKCKEESDIGSNKFSFVMPIYDERAVMTTSKIAGR